MNSRCILLILDMPVESNARYSGEVGRLQLYRRIRVMAIQLVALLGVKPQDSHSISSVNCQCQCVFHLLFTDRVPKSIPRTNHSNKVGINGTDRNMGRATQCVFQQGRRYSTDLEESDRAAIWRLGDKRQTTECG
jgi:hypothetical protein